MMRVDFIQDRRRGKLVALVLLFAILLPPGCDAELTPGDGPDADTYESDPAWEEEAGDSELTDSEEGQPDDPDNIDNRVAPVGIAVVNSDYMSTSISLIDPATGTLAADNVIHSGSRPPGLVSALSGDVMLAGSVPHDHALVLLDRYPNSVLTFLDPVSRQVRGQLPVSDGFPGNPHDVLFVDESKAYVTRNQPNPSAKSDSVGIDRGDDVLIVDTETREITGRIGLTDLIDPGIGLARPDRMAAAKGLVWVTLNHLNADFTTAGPGRLAAIDPKTDELTCRVELSPLRNCQGLYALHRTGELAVVCSGSYFRSERQVAHSGVVVLDLSTTPPRETDLFAAADIDNRPLAAYMEHHEARWLFVISTGGFGSTEPDTLHAIDRDTDEITELYQTENGFTLGSMLVDRERDRLYLCDANPETPKVLIFDLSDPENGIELTGSFDPNPSVGLPPRVLGWY